MPEDRLEQVLEQMRAENPSPEEREGARRRVWKRIQTVAKTSPVCAGFRLDLERYQARTLPDGRQLLVRDHLSRCVECRNLLSTRPAAAALFPAAPRRRASRWAPWAIAATLLLTLGYASRDMVDTALAPDGPRAELVRASGPVQSLEDGEIAPGAKIEEGEHIRTGAGTRAVLRLRDGSLVELNERTELAVNAAWSGDTIHLERGDVIVQAAKQRRGRLRVMTRDSVATVKGTVFAVSAGVSGSVVTVVEGAVQVEQPSGRQTLSPGQQASSSRSLHNVQVREAVGWSEDRERYYALLADLVQIERELASTLSPAIRTESRLLAYLPPNTRVFAAVPNLGPTVSQALGLIEQRSRSSETLRDWWNGEQQKGLRDLLERVQAVTPALGDEIVFLLVERGMDASGTAASPLILLEPAPGGEAAVAAALEQLKNQPDGPKFSFDAAPGRVAVASSGEELAILLPQLGQGAGSPFAAEIARRYSQGVGILAAFNLQHQSDASKLSSGEANAQFLFLEQKYWQGVEENQAQLTFDGERQGWAATLASPGPAGSADFASSNALSVLSFVTREPREALAELLKLSVAGDGSSGLFRELGIAGREAWMEEIAGTLGADFTVSVERAAVPMPGWVAMVEVRAPSAFDAALGRVVDAVNSKAVQDGKAAPLQLTRDVQEGRTWSTLRGANTPYTLSWTYERGYLVASFDRALIFNAIATANGGFPLVRSQEFQNRLPSSTGPHHSGFFWLNTRGALSGLGGTGQSAAVAALLESRDPVLVTLRGEPNQVLASSRARVTSLVLDLLAAGRWRNSEGSEPSASSRN